MTLRTEAGDKVIGKSRDRCREPTGSPVVRVGVDDAPEDLPGAFVQRCENARRRRIVGRDHPFKMQSSHGSGKGAAGADAHVQYWPDDRLLV